MSAQTEKAKAEYMPARSSTETKFSRPVEMPASRTA